MSVITIGIFSQNSRVPILQVYIIFFLRHVPSYVVDKQWHHVCITWLSFGGYLKVFVNGLKLISIYDPSIDGVVIKGIAK